MLPTAFMTEAEEGGFVALNPETGTTTQCETYEESIQNLREATSLYLDEFPMKVHSHLLLVYQQVFQGNTTVRTHFSMRKAPGLHFLDHKRPRDVQEIGPG